MTRRGRSEALAAFLFLAPNLLGFLAFFVVPLACAVALSFCRWNMLTDPVFVGLENYANILSDPMFWRSLFNTLEFAALSIPLSIAGSMLLALALNRSARGIGALRAVFFLPSVCSIVAISILWQWLYDADQGLLNTGLRMLFGFSIDWLGDPRWAMPSIVLMSVWSTLGYNTLVYLAALQDIPDALYEAAALDGANRWERFRHVTLPGLSHVTTFVTVMSIIGAFQVFDQAYVMTRGGPAGATTTVVYAIFNNAFKWFKMGYACALAMILFAIIVAVTALYQRFGGGDSR